MDELLGNWKRSHMCGMVGAQDTGAMVTLMGWMQRRRDLGGVLFVWLRDRSGIVQVIFDDRYPQALERGNMLRNEYVVAVRGEVLARQPEMVNPDMPTGEIEVLAQEIKILSRAETPPFNLFDEREVSENLRLKYRFLDLRRPRMQRNLMLRHQMLRSARAYLDEHGFVDIETPILSKSTPEGARDYLVPSRVHPHTFYALPQSPQLFKQVLMASGFDRYYQIARCFRDEDLRADRQPEFTQIDVEMSFVEMEDVLTVGEGLIARLFHDTIGVELSLPLPRITYADAIRRYGSDKPDTRFGLELREISDIARDSGFGVFRDAVAQGGVVVGINATGCAGYSRKQIDALTAFVRGNKAGGLAWLALDGEQTRGSFVKFLTQEELQRIKTAMYAKEQDLLLFLAGPSAISFAAAGQLRLELGRQLNLMDPARYDVLWVTEFPFFELDEESGRYIAMHHPFTSPMDEDIDVLETQPHRVRAKAYDIVVNGTEVSSGSIRIHSAELQERMFGLLGIGHEEAYEKFGFLLEAFKYGVPPHGGLAPGVDRLAMLLTGESTIREVTAFPKLQNAHCPMMDAPGTVDQRQLQELHIALRELES